MTASTPLIVIDRLSQQPIEEEVWGDWGLQLLYGPTLTSRTVGRLLLHTLFRWPLLSWAVGKYYDTRHSRRLIAPFCRRFHIDLSEQLLPLDQFISFNDFFTRRLRPGCRPHDPTPSAITIPADGRYSIITALGAEQKIPVKNQSLDLDRLLGSKKQAARFYGGTAVIGRLCPADNHRFYFPASGKAGRTSWIHGSLFSVNPIATSQFPWIFWTNRRAVTYLETQQASTIAYIEVGATNCGTIVQDFIPDSWVKKGQEKGFFRLGGSAIILLFEPGQIAIADDLLALSSGGHEILCRIGQLLGHALS